MTGQRLERELLTPEELMAALMRHPDDGMARYRAAFARGDGMWVG